MTIQKQAQARANRFLRMALSRVYKPATSLLRKPHKIGNRCCPKRTSLTRL